LAALVPDPKRPNVPLKRDANEAGEHGDDGCDAARYAVASFPYAITEPVPDVRAVPGRDPGRWQDFVTIPEEGRELPGGMLM
jgi:hypothetical protein